MGNDIQTVRSKSSDYWAAYVCWEKKSKLTDLNDPPEPMSLPINDLPSQTEKLLWKKLVKQIGEYMWWIC